jgi:hypothetical protein
VTFLDFGLVKRWGPGELEALSGVLDAVLSGDPEATLAELHRAGFLPNIAGLTAQHVYDYVATPWLPFVQDHFTYTRRWVSEMLARMMDISGEYGDVIRASNIPTSYVILDRVVWGYSALFGRLRASANWRAMLAEYRKGAPPSTELGRVEAAWRADRQVPAAVPAR